MLNTKRKYIFNTPNLKPKRQYLRNNSTPQEKLLWVKLKKSQLGHKFRRQYSLRGYILDFYCPSKKLGIELDGKPHLFNQPYDKYRSRYLEAFGIKILRFWNWEVENELNSCIRNIKNILDSPS